MKYCQKCGAQNPDEAQFCADCGAPFIVESREKNTGKTWISVILIIVVVIAAIVFIINSNNNDIPNSGGNDEPNLPTSTEYVDNSEQEANAEDEVNTIDKQKIENVISSISRCSSKGGDYRSLGNYFTYEISPHPSGEKRYNYNIGEKMESYTSRFSRYEISSPYNIQYLNSTFPLTVKCDVTVSWVNTRGDSKKAILHRTFFITSEYKVSGYKEVQENL